MRGEMKAQGRGEEVRGDSRRKDMKGRRAAEETAVAGGQIKLD